MNKLFQKRNVKLLIFLLSPVILLVLFLSGRLFVTKVLAIGTITLTSPIEGSYVRGLVSVSAAVSYSSGPDNIIEFYNDTEIKPFGKTPLSSGPYFSSWNTITNSIPDGFHTLYAKGTDRFGDSAVSSVITVLVDNTSPIGTLIAPVNGATLGNLTTFSVSAADTMSGVEKVEFYRDSGVLMGAVTTFPYSVIWDPATTTDGSHTWYVKVFDRAGNTITTTPQSILVNVFPTIMLVTPTQGATVPKGKLTTMTATAWDNDSILNVKFYVNGSLVCTDTSAPYSCNWNVPKTPHKIYNLKAMVTDRVNNQVYSELISVTSGN